MFTLALSIGIYSYLIFALGLANFLYPRFIIFLTLSFIIFSIWLKKKSMITTLQCAVVNLKQMIFTGKKKLRYFLIFMLGIQMIVNLIGTLGPELGFDALWYHLTIPKIYLENHSINYIPGGLFYYSAMPKLTEMLYVAGLAFGSETFAKLIHFSFGILSLIALYNLSRKFLSNTLSLLVLVLFYSNLVVGWMSITAYVDLARTFFEIMAFWGFLEWFEKKEKKWFVLSAIMLGLAISTKLLAIGSLLIFFGLIVFYLLSKREKFENLFIGLFVYWLICLLIPLPWFIFSYIHTGNPVYPFFTNIYPVRFNFNLINPLNISDPISPFYVISLPLAVFFYRKFKPSLKLVSLYSFFAIAVWYLTPRTGGGRFILPYLPAFSIVTVVIIKMIKKEKVQSIFVGMIIFFAVFSIIYRGVANLKYFPVILGKETKAQFLSNHLNFSFGDFYDTDGYFARKIKQKDMVLLYGFHNLYYVNFPFIDSSYVKKGDMFNYIAVQGNNLPKRFKIWSLIYYNDKTNVKLYSIGHSTLRNESSGSDSKRGLKWIY